VIQPIFKKNIRRPERIRRIESRRGFVSFMVRE
jgi:hypothetical protein